MRGERGTQAERGRQRDEERGIARVRVIEGPRVKKKRERDVETDDESRRGEVTLRETQVDKQKDPET